MTKIAATGMLPDPLSILLVGEGNLSFAHALVRRLSRSRAFRRARQSTATPDAANVWGSEAEVVATTFDSEAEIATKYPESAAFRTYFSAKQRIPVRYFGSVNATALLSSLTSAHVDITAKPFHLIMFNNPHIGFEDLYRQRSLLSHFFASAAALQRSVRSLHHPQEVVVALCDDQAQRWDLLGCAARSGYVCVAAQPLRPADYPEYTNRRHQSDAAFPFQRMVQYWFVQPSQELQVELLELRDEIAAWERMRHEHTMKEQPCSFSCTSWLQVADAVLAPPPSANRASVVTGKAPCLNSNCSRITDFSLNSVSCNSTVPMPLLHPKLVAQVLTPLLFSGSEGEPRPDRELFTPYLPRSTWVPLYQAQRCSEEQYCTVTAASANECDTVPPHLDAAHLGRPLTAKEEKKLTRYLSNYGAAMRVKALQRKEQAVTSQRENSWLCTNCTPPRTFDTEQDLLQHQCSKHSGTAQLAPTLYARVHHQIKARAQEFTSGSLEASLEAMSLRAERDGLYCSVCGLQYKTPEDYEEHLLYLSPLPGDVETCLTCDLCEPSKRFTDLRGLVQHRSSKHPGA